MKNRAEVTAVARIQGGLPILGCLPGSPAAEAGIRYGDILMSMNGSPVSTLQDFLDARLTDGTTQRLEVFRDGEVITFTLGLRDMSDVSPHQIAQEIVAGRYLGGEAPAPSDPAMN